MRVVWPSLLLLASLATGTAAAAPTLEVAPTQGEVPMDVELRVGNATGQWFLVWTDPEGGQHAVATGDEADASIPQRIETGGTHRFRVQDEVGNATATFEGNATTMAEGATVVDDPPLISAGTWPIWIAAVLMLALAVFLLVHDRRNPINIAFAVLFIARGLADIANGFLLNSGSLQVPPLLMQRLHPVLSIAVVAAALYFLLTYIAQNNARWARRPFALPIIGVAAVLAVVAALRPSLYWGTGPLFLFTGLYYPLYTLAVWLLVRQSRRDLPDDRRDGLVYSAIGLAFLPAYVGVGELLFVDGLGALDGVPRGVGFYIGHFAAVLALLPLGLAFAELLAERAKHPTRRHTGRHLGLFTVALVLPVLSLAAPLALYDVGARITSQQESLELFKVFQGIWAIPYPVLVVVGVLRYQASDNQSKMRRQVRRFVLPSLFFTVFFGVSEGTEALLSSQWGTAAGLGAAAVMTLALRPVQAALEQRFGTVEVDPTAQTLQEVEFYREQVRRTLDDGTIGGKERRFLRNLAETMGIRDATAQAVEDDLVAELGRPAGTGAA